MNVRWITARTDLIPSRLGSQQLVFIVILSYSLTISLILAIPSMKYFEKPIIRISHKF
jgi:peptidoglycan/LPS O-acetylase OafA/YrhL